MPIYEYRCAQCGERFEELLRASDHRVRCPACGRADVERLPSTFAVGGTHDADPTACCGLDAPCSDPKRCCQR